MDKREAFLIVLSALQELEDTSVKVPSMTYSGKSENFSFYVMKNNAAFRTWLTGKDSSFYVESNRSTGDFTEGAQLALEEIERIKLIPDGPVEEMTTLQISVTKAKELGLIA